MLRTEDLHNVNLAIKASLRAMPDGSKRSFVMIIRDDDDCPCVISQYDSGEELAEFLREVADNTQYGYEELYDAGKPNPEEN